MSEELRYDVQDRIAHIQINRPKAMNAIHPDLMKDLSALIREADQDDERVSVLVLSGVGPNFSAGYDLKVSWGEIYGEDDVTAKRPGNGRSPMETWDVLGRAAPRDLAADEALPGEDDA